MVLKDGNSIGTEEGGNVNRHWNELKNASNFKNIVKSSRVLGK